MQHKHHSFIFEWLPYIYVQSFQGFFMAFTVIQEIFLTLVMSKFQS